MRIFTIAVLSSFVCMMPATPVSALDTSGWKGYHSDRGIGTGYYIKYPPGWEPVERSASTVAFVSPAGSRVAVTITVRDMRKGPYAPRDLDEYVKIYDESIGLKFKDYTVIERERVTVSGLDACRSTYSYTDNIETGWRVKYRVYGLIVDNIWSYDAGYAASVEKFDEYFETADAILGSMEIFRNKPDQGPLVDCEECVVRDPEKYADDPGKCPVCGGKKVRFQPARMMDRETADALSEGSSL